jgi:hypothetical protein
VNSETGQKVIVNVIKKANSNNELEDIKKKK